MSIISRACSLYFGSFHTATLCSRHNYLDRPVLDESFKGQETVGDRFNIK